MIKIGKFHDLATVEHEEAYLIVRALKNMPKATPGKQIYHLPILSPSRQLFSDYQKWKGEGKWGEEMFREVYVPRFLEEMKGREQKNALNQLFLRSKTKDILLVCYCGQEDICHRSIVMGLLQGANAECDMTVDYSEYYRMYVSH